MTRSTAVFLCDALDPQREKLRRPLLDRLINCRVRCYADPGDRDAREALAEAQEALRVFDAGKDERRPPRATGGEI